MDHAGLKVSTWVIFKNVPNEFFKVATWIASRLRKVLDSNKKNSISVDQRFCIDLILATHWKTSFFIINVDTKKNAIILVDYYIHLIWYKFEFSIKYLIKYNLRLSNRLEEIISSTNKPILKERTNNTTPKISLLVFLVGTC